ncbi:hypothetical protein [Streptomyces sp. NBC_00872]|uniref:hypothetical protein n=1 Tax=Streptomyces sp. NBC_00872 TaxID=2903686 RepID=UPI00386D1F96|nr:hypothetical protein OG214_15610 [Streptomyces sp. NBC_00872]
MRLGEDACGPVAPVAPAPAAPSGAARTRGAAGGRMRAEYRLLAGALAAGALITATAGCAQSSDPVDPIERLGRKAAQKVGPHAPPPAPGADGGPGAVRLAPQPREMCPGEERPARDLEPGGGPGGGLGVNARAQL